MKWCISARFTFIMGFWGWTDPARSRGRARWSGGEAESFEAIVHLKEGPKLLKTLMRSKCCVVTIQWSQSWGPKCMVPPTSLLEACGSATDGRGQTAIVGELQTYVSSASRSIFLASHFL